MTEFLVKYWLEILFGAFIGIMGAFYDRVRKKLKQTEIENQALKRGMIAILHNDLYQTCEYYLSLGYIPLDKAEDILENAKVMYDSYHALGGNGTGTKIYNRFTSLELKRVDMEKEDNHE